MIEPDAGQRQRERTRARLQIGGGGIIWIVGDFGDRSLTGWRSRIFAAPAEFCMPKS